MPLSTGTAAQSSQLSGFDAGRALDSTVNFTHTNGSDPNSTWQVLLPQSYSFGVIEVFNRDAHCSTCHQPNGLGLPNIYPPLTDPDWIDNDERLIKIALKGLWGPIEVGGKAYDPTKGVPPMMGFAGLLNDEELAAVLSYVRQSFGNDGKFVSPEKVGEVRAATADRVNFYMVDEILKEHPIEKD